MRLLSAMALLAVLSASGAPMADPPTLSGLKGDQWVLACRVNGLARAELPFNLPDASATLAQLEGRLPPGAIEPKGLVAFVFDGEAERSLLGHDLRVNYSQGARTRERFATLVPAGKEYGGSLMRYDYQPVLVFAHDAPAARLIELARWFIGWGWSAVHVMASNGSRGRVLLPLLERPTNAVDFGKYYACGGDHRFGPLSRFVQLPVVDGETVQQLLDRLATHWMEGTAVFLERS